MGIVTKQRTIKTFQSKLSLKSKSTQAVYNDAFTNFERFCKEKLNSNLDDTVSNLKVVEEKDLFDTLQDWISWNVDGKRSRNTIRTWFSCISLYLHYRGIKIDRTDVKLNLTFPEKIQQELYGLSIDDIKNILEVARYDKKTMYLCQLSSGMRSGELLQIKKSDLNLNTKRIMVKIRPSIAKGKKARTTFFSKEAGKMLRTILKKKGDNDLIFGNDNSTVIVVRQYNEQGLINYCKKVGLAQKYENSPRFKITSHSFRAFFITKLSRHDENFAKKLAGQTGYLLQYDRMNDEEKLEKYIEFENSLTIYDDNKALSELEKIKQDKNKLALSVEDLQKKFVKINIEHEDYKRITEKIEQSMSEGHFKKLTPKEMKQIEKDIASGKIKDRREEDKLQAEKILEEKVRKVLSDPDILKKILDN